MTNPYAPPQATLADVVDPRPSNITAERGTRLAAAILDGLFFGGMGYAPTMMGFTFAGIASGGRKPNMERGLAAPIPHRLGRFTLRALPTVPFAMPEHLAHSQKTLETQ